MEHRTTEEQLIRYRAFAGMVGEATNVGESGDVEDVYDIFDTLSTDMARAMPAFACRDGCNQCCYFPPLVSSLEWKALYPHLLGLTAHRQQVLIEQAEALRPLAPELATLRRRMLNAEQAGTATDLALQCPMLIDGRCAVYNGRPLICRGFGHTLRQAGDRNVFYGSALALAHLRTNFPEDTALPLFDPYADRVAELNQHAGGTEAFLAQWLWAHIDNGAFLPEVIIRPAF
jgi:Fe-S-cluster containining protein